VFQQSELRFEMVTAASLPDCSTVCKQGEMNGYRRTRTHKNCKYVGPPACSSVSRWKVTE
jgi:hypothetical protein